MSDCFGQSASKVCAKKELTFHFSVPLESHLEKCPSISLISTINMALS